MEIIGHIKQLYFQSMLFKSVSLFFLLITFFKSSQINFLNGAEDSLGDNTGHQSEVDEDVEAKNMVNVTEANSFVARRKRGRVGMKDLFGRHGHGGRKGRGGGGRRRCKWGSRFFTAHVPPLSRSVLR